MKALIKTTIVLTVLGIAGAVAYPYAAAYWKARNRPKYRKADVVRGNVTAMINANGTVQPVLRVSVGSFVSGPVVELNVDYNSKVAKGQVMARIDARLYKAALARDQAALATQKAEVERAKAHLQQAINDEQRAMAFRAENAEYISDAEMDQYKFNRIALDAQLKVAEAAVQQAQGNLENSKTNLEYTEIRSPVDGIVIDRKIDEGQTLASAFQTPELFIVAPEMEKRMLVHASVDEADIGLIRKAQQRKQKVEFTVDAYPDDLFEGQVSQVRVNPTTTQNVVTYTVVVEAANPEMKLLPGMTATLSFKVDECRDTLRIPNAALRFYPKLEQVRASDRKLLEGTENLSKPESEEEEVDTSGTQRPAAERVKASRDRSQRHVWVDDGEFLRAVPVVVGLNDYQFTQLVSGSLKQGDALVTGIDVTLK
jgi:HlyD family secretion protein